MQTDRSSADLMTTWYRKAPGAPVHEEVVPYGKSLLAMYRTSHQYDRLHERIYQATAMRRHGAALAVIGSRIGGDALARLNVAKAVVDTVSARMSKRRAMPAFKVDMADWSLKRRAKKYRQFIVGKMMDSQFEELSPLIVRDGCVVGSGVSEINDEGADDICAERVYRDELLIDPRETKYGKPWQLMRVMRVSRDALREKFKGDKGKLGAIENAPASQRQPHESLDDPEFAQVGSLDGYIDVWKAWCRPSSDDAKDGRYVCVIDGATLHSELWECERFPFAVFRYDHPMRGYWGRGLIEQVADIQHRINCIVRDVQMNIEAVGKGSYLVNEQFDIPVEMMSGSQPFKFMYRGPQAPQWNAPAAVSGQTLQLLEFFIRQAFELPGVSQAAASSKSALGLNASGVALDTQYDIESERFAMQERQYAKFRLDAGQLFLDAAKRVAKRREEDKGKKKSSSYVSTWRTNTGIESIDYSKVALDDGQYRLELEPVNFIPDTRAGKIASIQELTAAGVIPQWLAAALYDEPDLQKAQMINCAAYFNQERIMEELGDENLPMVMPEPEHDLALALKMGLAFFNYAQAEKAPEEVVSRYRMYVDAVREMKLGIPDPSAAPAMDPNAMPVDPAMGGAPAPGGPMPPMPPGGGAPLPPEMAGLPMPVAA
jgi:hypothetical protein